MGLLDGVLPAIYRTGDRAKKRVNSLLDPQTYRNALNYSNFQPLTEQELTDGLLGGGVMGRIVFHGSPHVFSKFDSSKIGTGSGVQAQGRGIYLSDAERVAAAHAGEGGKVYSVDLPDEAIGRMLQWQERVANQPKEVRRGLLNALGPKSYKLAARHGTGSDIYNTSLAYLSEDEAAQLLRSVGIPGIRYQGNGTTNSVIFPGEAENLLRILGAR